MNVITPPHPKYINTRMAPFWRWHQKHSCDTSKSVVCTEEFTIYGGFKSDTPLPGWSNFGERQSHNGTVCTRPSKSGQTHNHVSTVKSFSAMIRCIENQRKHHPKICAKCSPLTLSKGLKKRTPSHENVNTFLGGDVGPWENQLFWWCLMMSYRSVSISQGY